MGGWGGTCGMDIVRISPKGVLTRHSQSIVSGMYLAPVSRSPSVVRFPRLAFLAAEIVFQDRSPIEGACASSLLGVFSMGGSAQGDW